MTNAIQIFQKDKDLFDLWTAMAVTDNFQKVITYARAAILENGGLTPDMLMGVNLMATTLVTMCNEEHDAPSSISTGLVHDLQPKRNTKKPEPVKPATKKE